MPFLRVLPEEEITPVLEPVIEIEEEVKFVEVSAVDKHGDKEIEFIELPEQLEMEPQEISEIQEQPENEKPDLQENEEIAQEISGEIEQESPEVHEEIMQLDSEIPESQEVTGNTQEVPEAVEQIEIEPETPEIENVNLNENEDIDNVEVPAAPEELSDISESVHDIESDSGGDVVQEIQEESQSEQESPEQDSNEGGQSEEANVNDKYTGVDPQYDFTSGKRYVDLVSTKTDFDRMLDELASISHDIIEHEAERFAKKYTGKFQGDFDRAEADAKKFDAFLGGYITNAAMLLYDHGHREVAIQKLEETKKILEARKKLEDETAEIHARVEEEDAVVDLSDILGMFGDG